MTSCPLLLALVPGLPEWAALGLLAQVPETTMYIHPVKLGAFVLLFAVWTLFAQWVDKDTIAVNTYRLVWNMITLGVGVATALALLIPLFVAAFPAAAGMNLALMLGYVLHRNKLVPENDRVLTGAHFRRLREQGLFGKKKVKEVKERVRLTNAEKKVVAIPEEDPEREQYRVTQDLLFNALWRRAAILEIAPAGAQAAKVTLLVDGFPVEADPLPRAEADGLVQYIKLMAGLNVEERRKPQKGNILAAIGENKHRVIVRTDGSTAGEKLTLRIVYREAKFKVPDLGFNPKQLEQVMATRDVPRGLILVSAPPASGLTTSVYSFMRTHDCFMNNIQTVEYEKEIDVENVTQNVFVPAEGTTFAERLLKLVRSDPDVIVLPEVREREAAVVAAKAAAEKQRVYVGVSAADVFEALRKWIAMVGDRGLASRALIGVTNQRLVRTLCPECKQAYKPDPQMMRKLNLPEDKVLYRPPEPQVDKHGHPIICQVCQGLGYVGRTGVFDWLPVDEPLREVIRTSTSMSQVQNFATKRGGLGLQNQGLIKVLESITSIQEVARALRGEPAAPARAAAAPSPGPAPKPRPVPQPATRPRTGGSGQKPVGS